MAELEYKNVYFPNKFTLYTPLRAASCFTCSRNFITSSPPPATLLQLGWFLLSMFFAFNCKIAFLLQTTRRMRNAQRAKTGSKTCGWSNKLPQLAAPSTKSLIPVAALMCLNHYKLLNRGEDLPLYRSLPLSAPSSLDHSLRPCWERQKCNLNLVLWRNGVQSLKVV